LGKEGEVKKTVSAEAANVREGERKEGGKRRRKKCFPPSCFGPVSFGERRMAEKGEKKKGRKKKKEAYLICSFTAFRTWCPTNARRPRRVGTRRKGKREKRKKPFLLAALLDYRNFPRLRGEKTDKEGGKKGEREREKTDALRSLSFCRQARPARLPSTALRKRKGRGGGEGKEKRERGWERGRFYSPSTHLACSNTPLKSSLK